MRLGTDFDNTVVCYDRLFHRVCRERGLVPETVAADKSEVRDYLRRIGREDDWTEVQGQVYGPRMGEAEPFPGVLEFFRACGRAGVPVSIISHKTRQPYRGQPYDLHEAAFGWLTRWGFFDASGPGLTPAQVYLELSKEAKLERVGTCACTHFIDDLPEFLLDPGFPAGVRRILFDPNGHYQPEGDLVLLRSWEDALGLLT